ncbi:MAG: hypothetical protein OZSIB_3196 [Candidatus Ozemobacter sibiricus]|uniref:Uncharacterized protein n=1 Tax=Candidatus Ozemobacter sibiricus TaxID=2268124 RepID=A0A367ZQY2_9BACT|nr:MAG: hypothetical protein OZSIB_3196 [Candidatus Ozemobacter sibiricus]
MSLQKGASGLEFLPGDVQVDQREPQRGIDQVGRQRLGQLSGFGGLAAP